MGNVCFFSSFFLFTFPPLLISLSLDSGIADCLCRWCMIELCQSMYRIYPMHLEQWYDSLISKYTEDGRGSTHLHTVPYSAHPTHPGPGVQSVRERAAASRFMTIGLQSWLAEMVGVPILHRQTVILPPRRLLKLSKLSTGWSGKLPLGLMISMMLSMIALCIVVFLFIQPGYVGMLNTNTTASLMIIAL